MPQKRYLVQSSFYVFADNEEDLDSICELITKRMEAHIDGSNMTIDKKFTAGFAEIVKSIQSDSRGDCI